LAVTLQETALARSFSLFALSSVVNNSTYPVGRATRQRLLMTDAMGNRSALVAHRLHTECCTSIEAALPFIAGRALKPVGPPLSPFTPGIQAHPAYHNHICRTATLDWITVSVSDAVHNCLVHGSICTQFARRTDHEQAIESGKARLISPRYGASSKASQAAHSSRKERSL